MKGPSRTKSVRPGFARCARTERAMHQVKCQCGAVLVSSGQPGRIESVQTVNRCPSCKPDERHASPKEGQAKALLLVVIESPFQGLGANVAYARLCMRDSLKRGEAPIASHLLYPQVLEDAEPEDRQLGMAAGFAWGIHAQLVAVYTDRGVTPGMQRGIEWAQEHKIPLAFRSLHPGGVGAEW